MNLLRGVVQARDEATASSKRRPKLVLKISPDLDSRGVDDIADAIDSVKGIDGIIVTNTTVQRPTHLRSGAYLTPLFIPFLLIPNFEQRIAQSKAVSLVRHYNPSHLELFATYANASLPKCLLSAVVVSHPVQTPWPSLVQVLHASSY